MWGRMGSGLTPPNHGLRSWWISVTRMRPPASSRGDPAGAGAVHRLDEDRQVGRLEGVEVERAPQEALVARIGIEALDQAGRLGLREGPPRDGRAAVGRDGRLEHGQDLRAGRRARGRLDLEAVVRPGVVGGGDDDAGRGAALDDLVGGHLGGDGLGGEGDRDVVRQQHLGGRGGEVLAGEAPVVGDDHAPGARADAIHVAATPWAQRRTFS